MTVRVNLFSCCNEQKTEFDERKAKRKEEKPKTRRSKKERDEGEAMVLMALDYGSKTVGVAVSDALGIAAHPLETIIREHENKLRRTLARIEEIVLERGVEKIILGKPLHMDSSEGERVKKTEDFKLLLEKRLGKEIIYIDERLTSAEAKELLSESGIKAGEMKKYIDSVAASLMLKEYMAAESRRRENDERQ